MWHFADFDNEKSLTFEEGAVNVKHATNNKGPLISCPENLSTMRQSLVHGASQAIDHVHQSTN